MVISPIFGAVKVILVRLGILTLRHKTLLEPIASRLTIIRVDVRISPNTWLVGTFATLRAMVISPIFGAVKVILVRLGILTLRHKTLLEPIASRLTIIRVDVRISPSTLLKWGWGWRWWCTPLAAFNSVARFHVQLFIAAKFVWLFDTWQEAGLTRLVP